ncbi:MAG TPA: PilT/PilU family type 4a pilus ATPase [Actinomycetota bacterium]|nr:PilT/PilU family type 4a pilus ATPase [Actinomycetota bacterium]
MRDIESLLRLLAERQGSDLHLKVGSPPLIRVDGILTRLEEDEPLRPDETEYLARQLIPEERWQQFLQKYEIDLAHGIKGVGRFRVHAFRQRGSVSVVLRLTRVGSPSFEELGLPPVCRSLADQPRGLILVTGPTGSGKTTTLAAMIDHINHTRPGHIVTVEDPIEVVHPDRLAAVNQREVGLDTPDFITALRAAMREDPDVILIGEMRDQETVQAALQAAETGHLVLATLHTIDATETINRIVDFFPPYQQQQVRVTLAGSLRGILCQRLVQRKTGGRMPAIEVLINNGRIAERILESVRTSEIEQIVAEGGFYGMQTFDQALLVLVQEGEVDVQEALEHSTNRHDFQLSLEQNGIAVPAA